MMNNVNNYEVHLSYYLTVTNLLFGFGSLIVFEDVVKPWIPIFPTRLDPAVAFLSLLPPLAFFLFFFFSWEGGEGRGGGTGGGEGRDSLIAFLSSGVR